MGTNRTMSTDIEKKERELRAARLTKARRDANLGGARRLSQIFGWNENTYKAHESARNGFGIADARAYAKAFNVSLPWLYFNIGSPTDPYVDTSEMQREIIDLFDALPPKMQEAQLESLRRIVEAISGEDPSK
nr:hypothetical protein 5 [Spirochaetaceae bacterium]BDD44749.1 hypothetical protein 7 [bacterium]BDD45562.1 hypothetical protein 11 [bacterium]